MLPGAGYFKSLTCPFFKSGYCERPHCHFRHVAEPAAIGRTVRPGSDEALVPGAAGQAAPSVDSSLLQELVSRAVREALQSRTAATLLAESQALETEAPATAPIIKDGHRLYPVPTSVSYSPTPLRELHRRGSASQPCFSDEDDDQAASGSPAPSAAAEAVPKAPQPAATAEDTASRQSEEFDLLDQILAESSRSVQMTTLQRRRLRARPVVFKARPPAEEWYEPSGAAAAGDVPEYMPTRRPQPAPAQPPAAASSPAPTQTAARTPAPAAAADPLPAAPRASTTAAATTASAPAPEVACPPPTSEVCAQTDTQRHAAGCAQTAPVASLCHGEMEVSTVAASNDTVKQPPVATSKEKAVGRTVPDDHASTNKVNGITDAEKQTQSCVDAASAGPASAAGVGSGTSATNSCAQCDYSGSNGIDGVVVKKERDDLVPAAVVKRERADSVSAAVGGGGVADTTGTASTSATESRASKKRPRTPSDEVSGGGKRPRGDERCGSGEHHIASHAAHRSRSSDEPSREIKLSKEWNKQISSSRKLDRQTSSSKDRHKRTSSSKELANHTSSSKDPDKHARSLKDRDKHTSSSKERNKHVGSSKDRDKHARSSKERDKHNNSGKERSRRASLSKGRDKDSSPSKERHKHDSSSKEEKQASSTKDRDTENASSSHKSRSHSSKGGADSGHVSSHKHSAKHSSTEHRNKKEVHKSSRAHKSSHRSDDGPSSRKHSGRSADRDEKSRRESSSHASSDRGGGREAQHDSSRHSSDARRDKSSRSSAEKEERVAGRRHTSGVAGRRQPTKRSRSSDGGQLGPSGGAGGGGGSGSDAGRDVADEDSVSSDSPLPDLSALEELPDDWEYASGLLQPSDLSDDDEEEETLAECERLFNEYRAPTDEPQLTASLTKAREMQEKAAREAEKTAALPAVGKKRVAHVGGPDQITRKVSRSAPKVTPAQAMHARWQKLAELQQQRITQLEEEQRRRVAEHVPLRPVLPSASVPKRRRVAHVPNVSALLAKPAVAEVAASSAGPGLPSGPAVTTARTAPSGGRRLAHTPTTASVARPRIPAEFGGKVPTAIRQRYLDHFCNDLLKISPNNEAEAFRRALEEEQSVYNRSSSRRVYVNVAVTSVKRLRDAAAASRGAVAAPVANRTVSHLDVLAGKGGATGTWSIERSKKAEDVKADELYDRLQQYLLTADQLDENGFPRCDGRGRPGRASLVHVDGRQKVTLHGATCRECLRCNRTYGVSPTDYAQMVPDQCVYHWGRVFTRRGQKLYSCCMQDAPADGCCVADCHVSDAFDPDHMDGFVATMDKSEPADGNYGVYALDCEMCYTVHGSELTRITVIDAHGATVFESLVRPSTPIIDFNTRFSGIKASDMEGVSRSIRDVQAVLLNMFSSRTILIGHSLESDFKALKLIHSTVVDTSVVFPHKLGRPFKRALRNLCSDYLKRIIQNDVGGHDSAEDAISCMDLMLWRLKEDAKSRH